MDEKLLLAFVASIVIVPELLKKGYNYFISSKKSGDSFMQNQNQDAFKYLIDENRRQTEMAREDSQQYRVDMKDAVNQIKDLGETFNGGLMKIVDRFEEVSKQRDEHFNRITCIVEEVRSKQNDDSEKLDVILDNLDIHLGSETNKEVINDVIKKR